MGPMIIDDQKVEMPRVAELSLSELPLHARDGGELTVVEGGIHVPFLIARVFTLRAPTGSTRGDHAHRRCAQFMTCPQGIVEIICDDGRERKSFLLDRANLGLLVPASFWSLQSFRCDNSCLIVICDRPYEANDYIRDYVQFREWRGVTGVARPPRLPLI
jgi:hypothetical protein